jgi:protein-L-isoaspartate(D-aspartate) O-methyltransferase
MPDYAVARRNMVAGQIRTNQVTDPALIAALEEIPREIFAPPALAGVAYLDEDLPLGGGRHLMEPRVFARLLQSAGIERTDVVLDIGCATGYSSAVISRLAATVVALESDPVLIRKANEAFARLELDNAVVVDGPLASGYPAQAPFDVIVIEGSVPEVPAAIAAQLAEGGRLFAVVAPTGGTGQAVLMLRRGGVVSGRAICDASTPPLPGFEIVPGFQF